MKTGGTSLRRMLISELGEQAVYPNDRELSALANGWYPSSEYILQNLATIRDHQVLVGHHPFSLQEKLGGKYKPVTVLREPISRTVSMLGHRKRIAPGYEHLTYEELLEDREFVEKQILNYQTKILSMSLGPVNAPQNTGEAELKIAVNNLNFMALLGINEHFFESCCLFDKINKTKLSANIKYENVNTKVAKVSESLRDKIKPLVELDLVLYQEALKKFKNDLSAHGIRLIEPVPHPA